MAATKRMHRLVAEDQNSSTATIEAAWRDCQHNTTKISNDDFLRGRATFLLNLVCNSQESRSAMAKAIIRNSISYIRESFEMSVILARGLLSQDGKNCAATNDLDDDDKIFLHTFSPGPIVTPSNSSIQE